MQYAVNHGPTFSTLDVALNVGETVVAQPGAMLAMTTGIDVTARVGAQMEGRRVARGVRSLLAGESFFAVVYTAKRDAQRVSLAPEMMGEIVPVTLAADETLLVASGAFLACDTRLRIDTRFGGMKSFLARTGLFLLHAQGAGLLFVASYGTVVSMTLAPDERLVVDNRYLVAFSETLTWEVVKATDSLRHSLMSGEGLVNRFTGPGRILYQTRSRPQTGWLQNLLQFAR